MNGLVSDTVRSTFTPSACRSPSTSEGPPESPRVRRSRATGGAAAVTFQPTLGTTRAFGPVSCGLALRRIATRPGYGGSHLSGRTKSSEEAGLPVGRRSRGASLGRTNPPSHPRPRSASPRHPRRSPGILEVWATSPSFGLAEAFTLRNGPLRPGAFHHRRDARPEPFARPAPRLASKLAPLGTRNAFSTSDDEDP